MGDCLIIVVVVVVGISWPPPPLLSALALKYSRLRFTSFCSIMTLRSSRPILLGKCWLLLSPPISPSTIADVVLLCVLLLPPPPPAPAPVTLLTLLLMLLLLLLLPLLNSLSCVVDSVAAVVGFLVFLSLMEGSSCYSFINR